MLPEVKSVLLVKAPLASHGVLSLDTNPVRRHFTWSFAICQMVVV